MVAASSMRTFRSAVRCRSARALQSPATRLLGRFLDHSGGHDEPPGELTRILFVSSEPGVANGHS